MYTDKALQIISELYEGKLDKRGFPAILHPLSVAMRFKEQDKMFVCALLHDVIEDELISEDQLRLIFPDDYVDTILVLTRKKYQTYRDYIQSIILSQDMAAIQIKLSDLENNIERNKGQFPEQMKRHQMACKMILSVL